MCLVESRGSLCDWQENTFRILVPDPRTGDFSAFLAEAVGRAGSSESSSSKNTGMVAVTIQTGKEVMGHSNEVESGILKETLRECKGILDRKYSRALDIWLNVLTKGTHKSSSPTEDEAAAKRLAHLKKVTESLLRQYDTLFPSNETRPSEENEEEDEFEDVKEDEAFVDVPEGFLEETQISREKTPARDEKGDEGFQGELNVSPEEKLALTDSSEALSREDLLKRAPVITYGPDLEHWGKKITMNVVANADMIESYWFRQRDMDNLPNPFEDFTYMRSVPIQQTPQGQIKACRAPTTNGKICERRDIESCPFHGPVINRDEKGAPVAQGLFLFVLVAPPQAS